MSHLVIIDVGDRGDPIHESSVVKVLAGAGQAILPGRSVRRTLVEASKHNLRDPETWDKVVAEPMQRGRRPMSVRKQSSRALAGATGVQATARKERTSGVNWGPSAAGEHSLQPEGIMHKPQGGCRGADVAIVSNEPVGQHNQLGSQGPLDSQLKSEGFGTVWSQDLSAGKMPENETRAVTAYKPACQRWRRWPLRPASLKPYWGKPAVRNFRGGGRNEVHGLMTFCHAARKGRYIGSH